MSAEAFRRVLNNIPRLKSWITGQTGDQTSFIFQTRASSKQEIRSSTVDHILPLEQLNSILGPGTAQAIFKEVKNNPSKYSLGFEDIEYLVVKDNKGNPIQESLVFKDVKFDNLNKTIIKDLSAVANNIGVSGEAVAGAIEGYLEEYKIDKGHVFGWANSLVYRTKTDLRNQLTAVSRDPEQLKKELEALDNFIDALLDTLEEYDIVTSDIKGLSSNVFAKYRKTDKNWLIEWQGRVDNQKSGGKVSTALGKSSDKGVRSFIKSVAYSNQSLIESSLRSMVDGFVQEGIAAKGSLNITAMESSPSMKDMFVDTIVATLTSTRKKYNKEYIGTINNIAKPNLRIIKGAEKAKASIAKTKRDLLNIKSKAKSIKNIAKNKTIGSISTTNLINLQSLINASLYDQIRKNMGKGERTDVLNYRTGRFARSAEVNRMTMSREGAITAFYTYMKNPYATFSEGGQQSRPRTRDPKLLISKSIREIAATRVANRLRAVVV
jgi:hypothetical protein